MASSIPGNEDRITLRNNPRRNPMSGDPHAERTIENYSGRAAGGCDVLVWRWGQSPHFRRIRAYNRLYDNYKYDPTVAIPDGAGGYRAFNVELVINNHENGRHYLYDVVGIKENAGISNATAAIMRSRREGKALHSVKSVPNTEAGVDAKGSHNHPYDGSPSRKPKPAENGLLLHETRTIAECPFLISMGTAPDGRTSSEGIILNGIFDVWKRR